MKFTANWFEKSGVKLQCSTEELTKRERLWFELSGGSKK